MRVVLLSLGVLCLSACTPPRIELTSEETELVRLMHFPNSAEDARQTLIALHPEWPEDIRQALLAKEIPPPRHTTPEERQSYWRSPAPERPIDPRGISRIQAIAAWGPPSSRSAGFLVLPFTDIWTYNDVTPPIIVWFVADTLDHAPYYEEYPSSAVHHVLPRGKFGYQKVDARDSQEKPTHATIEP